jgi:hypothetical protein
MVLDSQQEEERSGQNDRKHYLCTVCSNIHAVFVCVVPKCFNLATFSNNLLAVVLLARHDPSVPNIHF